MNDLRESEWVVDIVHRFNVMPDRLWQRTWNDLTDGERDLIKAYLPAAHDQLHARLDWIAAQSQPVAA